MVFGLFVYYLFVCFIARAFLQSRNRYYVVLGLIILTSVVLDLLGDSPTKRVSRQPVPRSEQYTPLSFFKQ